jgi:glycerate dehydrogenase
MTKTVMLNASKVDFDSKLDFSKLSQTTDLMKYDNSNEDEFLERCQGQDAIISKELPLPASFIKALPPSVKLICEAGTGYNNIDIEAAKQKGITVCNIPTYSTEAVAQLVIAFILNLSSSISLQKAMLERGDKDNFQKYLMVTHFEVSGKTLGIIGAGSIGTQVMKVALALRMNILVYTRTPKEFESPYVKSVTLEQLLAESDFVTINCPLTDKTKHLIDKSKLSLMKSSAFIINTARGAIINEADLIDALQSKTIAGAALDVQEQEPPFDSSPLYCMDNVILTPHIGWKCIESRQRLLDLLADNIDAYFSGNPINVVN